MQPARNLTLGDYECVSVTVCLTIYQTETHTAVGADDTFMCLRQKRRPAGAVAM